MDKIKVLLTYIIYPLAMGTYFKKALQHNPNVDLRVGGIYTGQFIPWMGGMNLPAKYAEVPDYIAPFQPNIGEYNYEVLMSQMGDWKPDLIIQVDAGLHFKYRPSDGMVVTVGTDPHVLNDWYDIPRKYSDRFFNMQKVYSKPGDIYLPYAYSQYDFYPCDTPTGERDLDAVLIGMPYDIRVQWADRLAKQGIKVHLENGPIFDEARALYSRTNIGLNWSSMDDLNCRAFELPAMKIFPVMNHVTDMSEFDFPDYCGIFHNMDEAVERVVWAKEHPDSAQYMADRAYEKVRPHTYDARVSQILKDSGFVV